MTSREILEKQNFFLVQLRINKLRFGKYLTLQSPPSVKIFVNVAVQGAKVEFLSSFSTELSLVHNKRTVKSKAKSKSIGSELNNFAKRDRALSRRQRVVSLKPPPPFIS